METKTLALTIKEIEYLHELVDAVSPTYGPTFNTEEFHCEFEGLPGSLLNEAEINTLYGKLAEALNRKA